MRFQPTGLGAHGLYPSRDSRRLFVSNRGEGSITRDLVRAPAGRWTSGGSRAAAAPTWAASPPTARVLWLSGRYNGEVYAISTRTGRLLHRIKVGSGPHGMAVWPQPGRYSIGHTGILR